MRLRVDKLQSGMITERDVYSAEGILIVPAFSPITENVIEKLRTYKVTDVSILEIVDVVEADEYEAGVPDPSRISVKERPEFAALAMECEKLSSKMKDSFVSIVSGDYTDLQILSLIKISQELCEQNKNNVGLMDMLIALKEKGDDTYMHSVNVGLISATLGRWLKWSEEDCKLLMTCGVFHDIGKMNVPSAILRKTEKLTDQEFAAIKRHPAEGFKILKEMGLDPEIQTVALLHHERCDGRGYPLGKKGDELDRFVKVVMIADAYEAMTSNRAHRKGICPFEVVRRFERDGFSTYEIPYLMTFLKRTVSVYIKSPVVLSDGRKGIVIMINDRDLANPVVKVGDAFIDLSKVPELYIESIDEEQI